MSNAGGQAMVGHDYGAVARSHAALTDARTALRAYRARAAGATAATRTLLAQAKAAALEVDDQALAGAVWCLETVLDAQDHYLNAWSAVQGDRYYSAWCSLERAELSLHWLARHFDDPTNEYAIAYLREHIPRWQALYPYKHFLSPGFTKRAIHCGICDNRITPRSACEHRLGDLYDGEMCTRDVKDMRLLEVSIVTRPVQKYSVVWLEELKYNYAAVHYVASGLGAPWNRWGCRLTSKRRLDPQFAQALRNEPCPCGSGKKFKKCHVDRAYYHAPHYDIKFHDGVAGDIPPDQFGVPHHGIDDHRGTSESAASAEALRAEAVSP
jgi:hypothetical protein